tara:strand:- start:122704 stop:124434 length:1731 start_codon:yes stop_codon:yes gene_type:complete
MINFNVQGDEDLKSLFQEISLICNARINYNLQLCAFFTNPNNDPEKNTEINDFWKTICPFSLDATLDECFTNFKAVAKSKASVYLEISKILLDQNIDNDIKILHLYTYVSSVNDKAKLELGYLHQLFENSLRTNEKKLRAANKKTWNSKSKSKLRARFSEVAKESSHFDEITTILVNYIKKSPINNAFHKTLIFDGELYGFYNPENFYNKNIEILEDIFHKVEQLDGLNNLNQNMLLTNQLVKQEIFSMKGCFEKAYANFSDSKPLNFTEYKALDLSKSMLNMTKNRFQHFHDIYMLSTQIKAAVVHAEKLVAYERAQTNSHSFLNIATITENASSIEPKLDNTSRDSNADNLETAVFQEKIITDELKSEKQPEACSSSTTSVNASQESSNIAAITQGLDDLSLDANEKQIFKPHWEHEKYKYKQVSKKRASAEERSPFIPLAENLKKKHLDGLLIELFSGSIHKKFSFKQLMKLIDACGGKVTNISGSIRRITLGKFASDTLEINANDNVKLNVHAPHGRHKAKEPVPSIIAKHFRFVLMQAGITPAALNLTQDIDVLRTPVIHQASSSNALGKP